MKKKTAPKQGSESVTPYLLYKDVGKALDWLSKAFGFVEGGERFVADDGTVQHADMKTSAKGAVILMGCPGAKYKNPKKLGGVTVMMYVTVTDVDKHFARAKKAGAKILEKPTDTFYGDRRYGATDLEGHQWYFAQHVRDVSMEEMQKAAKDRA
jgi:PhnB protein